MSLDPQFEQVPDRLHEALLTVPATKADCITHMRDVGGLTLSSAVLSRAIDLIIEDLFQQLILSASDYATLLARHQLANPDIALRELKISWMVVVLEYEREQLQQKIDDATALYMSLSEAQKTAIEDIKVVADDGITYLNKQITKINNRLKGIELRRNLGVQ